MSNFIASSIDRLRIYNNTSIKGFKSELIYDKAEFYDLIYPGFEGDLNFYTEVSNKSKVLYIGVGTGRIFSSIYANNPQVIGIDKSAKMIKILKEKYEINNENIKIGNILHSNFPSCSFELIIAPYAFLNYFNPCEILTILNKISKWLKPDGLFISDIFSPFDNPSFKENIEYFPEKKVGPYTFKTEISYDFVLQTLTEFTIVESPSILAAVHLNQYFYYPNEFTRLLNSSNLTLNYICSGFKKEKLNTSNQPIVFSLQKNASSFEYLK